MAVLAAVGLGELATGLDLIRYLRPGIWWVVIAISGSGNSENVVRALEYAKSQGSKIVCLTGYDGGKIHSMADCNVHIRVDDMQIAEDMHLVFIHVALKMFRIGLPVAGSSIALTGVLTPPEVHACVTGSSMRTVRVVTIPLLTSTIWNV